MTEFLESVRLNPALQYALIAGIIACVPFGVVGSFLVVRRIGYIAAAIAHSILGGIGAAIYFSRSYEAMAWFTPLLGATLAALLSALLIGFVSLRFREREDTLIGAIWATGMAAGLLFLHKAPGTGVSLESFLFGDILLTSRSDVWVTAIASALILLVVVLFYPRLIAVCFDPEFSDLRGVSSTRYYLLLLVLTAIAMVLLVRLAGIVLSLALLILPAATAARVFQRMTPIILGASFLSFAYLLVCFPLSYHQDLPTGPVIVVAASLVYGLTLLVTRRRGA